MNRQRSEMNRFISTLCSVIFESYQLVLEDTLCKGKRWYDTTIRYILTSEKYKGEALLQKTYTPDYLTHKPVPNNRIIRQYYVQDSHPAIIEPEVWEKVQGELKRRWYK